MSEREALLTLLEASYRRGVDVHALIAHFGSAGATLAATPEEWMSVERVGPAGALALGQLRGAFDAGALLERMRAVGVEFLAMGEKRFPGLLGAIDFPPLGLWVRGKVDALHALCISIVGARRATAYGLSVGRAMARELAEAGACIVSGLARGIDSAAHMGALEAEGSRTVAVLGTGIDVCYPRENRTLLERVAARGCAVSEFPPGTPPHKLNFPRRNRILSGLSQATIVVEASATSGSLGTAFLALDQGRDVFAVPGDVGRPLSVGPHRLLQQGAAPLTCAAELVRQYGLESPGSRVAAAELTAQEAALLEMLEVRGTHADWLAENAPGVLGAAGDAGWQEVLASLLVKGAARRLAGNRYCRGAMRLGAGPAATESIES
ncbi:MAG: DNA-protecting protein DprA [Candidatus Wallbacteria bacterium]|nr:DNA-protecting protein DprA [Candidatus Wallbacteria bacterium]